MTINGTTEPSELRDFSKIRQYLHGYVRDIYYTSHDPELDPRNTGANRIIYIYEGFYQNGKLSKDLEEIKFGRWFQTDSKCYIGYFTYDQQERDFLFFGKGMIIDGSRDVILQEGLYNRSLGDPQEYQIIEDFKYNMVDDDW